ncbi:MAG: glycosyltransferase family 2 protein [Bryobacterales bacterium]|nr:glycosyltransferase family 2 protein [Bryobacterales bacterium]
MTLRVNPAPSTVSVAHNLEYRGIEISVVVPTFNESENAPLLIGRIAEALQGVQWEVIVVDDDSPDGTADVVREIAQKNPRVRVIQRIGRRGLSGACIEGMLSSSSPYVAVIDADLQHDETLLPKMLHALKTEQLDVVVGSRYIAGGGIGEWDASRARISRVATDLARILVKGDLKDPMSGFFMLRSDVLQDIVRNLSGQGFKILLDLFASSERPLRFKELPYKFRTRQFGESKLDHLVIWEYLTLIMDKLIGKWVPIRFVMFALIGGIGVILHLIALRIALSAGIEFEPAQIIATLLAIFSNFTLNNFLTYRDRRLRGVRFIWGLVSFTLVCGAGAVANVGIASALFTRHHQWLLAGLSGAFIGAVWNYAVSSIVTWPNRRRPIPARKATARS